jgi:hypothetical protein
MDALTPVAGFFQFDEDDMAYLLRPGRADEMFGDILTQKMFEWMEEDETPAQSLAAIRTQQMLKTIKSLKSSVLFIDEPGPSRKQRKLKHPRQR